MGEGSQILFTYLVKKQNAHALFCHEIFSKCEDLSSDSMSQLY